jgi:hypothetical protein
LFVELSPPSPGVSAARAGSSFRLSSTFNEQKAKRKIMEDFFDGAGMETVSGPLIGGGLAQLGILGTRKFLPAQAKYAGLIGALIGGGVSAFLMSKPEHRQKGLAGLAVALLVGIPRQIEDLILPSKLSGADQIDLLGAYNAEMGAYNAEGMGEGEYGEGGIDILNSGSGSTGMLAAVVPENMSGDLGADVEIQDAGAFGATGF